VLTALGDPLTFDADASDPPQFLRFIGHPELWGSERELWVESLASAFQNLSEISGIDATLERATMEDFLRARTECLETVEAIPVIKNHAAGILGIFIACVDVQVRMKEGRVI
jgi:hypothetical protein